MSPDHHSIWWTRREMLVRRYRAEERGLQQVLEVLAQRLETILEVGRIRGTVKARRKAFDDFYRKVLQRSRLEPIDDPFTFITDLVALRIVTPFVNDVAVAGARIRTEFDVTEIDDKSSALSIREFGYDSTHLLVAIPDRLRAETGVSPLVAEIQLRTTLQDAWAEVEHELVYKAHLDPAGRHPNDRIRRKLIALNATLSLADTIFQEIRDHQQRRFAELRTRHQKLMDKVATIPERRLTSVSSAPSPVTNPPPNEDATAAVDVAASDTALDDMASNDMASNDMASNDMASNDTALNDIVVRALQAHVDADLDEAVALYSQVLAVHSSAPLFNHRGIAYLALGRYDDAIADFTQVIDMRPDEARAYTSRGLAKRMLGHLQEALVDLDRSFEIDPMWPDTLYGRALTHFDLGNVPAALRDCDRAIVLKPNFKAVIRFKRYVQSTDL